jgi:hypothetical protein
MKCRDPGPQPGFGLGTSFTYSYGGPDGLVCKRLRNHVCLWIHCYSALNTKIGFVLGRPRERVEFGCTYSIRQYRWRGIHSVPAKSRFDFASEPLQCSTSCLNDFPAGGT